jgi:acyl carrier protein
MSGTDNDDVIKQRLRAVFQAVLATDARTDELTTDNCERWDSLNHIKLILSMEKEFGLEIDTDAVDMLYSTFENCLAYVRGVGSG